MIVDCGLRIADLPKGEDPECGMGPRGYQSLVTSTATRVEKGGGDVPPRNLYDETSGELKAKLDLQPSMLAAESLYRPEYTGLDLKDLETLLKGTPGGTRTEQYTDYETVPAVYSQTQGKLGMLRGPLLSPEYLRPVMRSRSVDSPAQRGLLDILENDLAPASDRITAGTLSRQRQAEIADVENLGGRATAAYKAANPDQQALLDKLNSQAQEGLDLGATLDPSLRREVQQSVRQGQSARGMGLGMSDLAEEGLWTGMAANQLRQQRQSFAQGMVGVNAATTVDPFLATLGRPGINLAQSNQLLGQGLSLNKAAGPQLFGSSVNAGDVFDSNYNAANANANASANRSAGMQSALIGGGASIAAAGIFAAVL